MLQPVVVSFGHGGGGRPQVKQEAFHLRTHSNDFVCQRVCWHTFQRDVCLPHAPCHPASHSATCAAAHRGQPCRGAAAYLHEQHLGGRQAGPILARLFVRVLPGHEARQVIGSATAEALRVGCAPAACVLVDTPCQQGTWRRSTNRPGPASRCPGTAPTGRPGCSPPARAASGCFHCVVASVACAVMLSSAGDPPTRNTESCVVLSIFETQPPCLRLSLLAATEWPMACSLGCSTLSLRC